ncbi:MAG TPA: glycosyltransferase [Gemmatimonadales bacterium]
MSDRPFTIFDITEYFGETSGGVRTYLREKSAYVERHPALAQVVVVPGARDAVSVTGRISRHEVGVPYIPGQRPYRAMIAPGRVRAALERARPDVVEIGSSHAVPWLVRRPARRLGIPTLWFYHGHLLRVVAPRLDRDSPHRRLALEAAGRYVRRIARGVRATLVASDAVRADLERFGVERIVRVPLGVDTGTFDPSRRARRAEVRRRHGLEDGPLALYTGRFTTEKELDVAIDGWKRLRHRDATLLLVGAGPLGDRLTARARGSRIRVLPFEHDREALADLYAAADFYLAPGPAETFGLSAHEAMASGTPVLSVNQGGVAEQVERAGCGALYPIGDAAALAEAADRLLDGDRLALGARARAYIEAHHRWEMVFDRLFRIYRDTASGRDLAPA